MYSPAFSLALGRRIAYVDVPDGAALNSMVGMGMSPWMAEGLVTLERAEVILYRATKPA